MAIKAIFFDLDNTLTHRDLTVQAFSRHLFKYYQSNLNLAENHDPEIYIEKIIDIVRRIDNGGYPKKEVLTHPSIGASVAYALIQELDWLKAPNLDDLAQFWFQQFGLCAVAMDGAEVLLQQLKQDQYKLAVISNGGHATRLKIIEGLGYLHYFDEIFSSERVGVSKPKAEIFLHCCDHLNVSPAETLYIGDHPINDYQGAKNAGLYALWFEGFHDNQENDIPAQHQIQHLNQVLDYLNTIK